jgi:glycosyltransferase involved in cell wall biosynthesis
MTRLAAADVPLVSVVLIFLNEERFLEEAIASVRAQSHRRWELLLVDDGSTDQSSGIAQRHAREQPDRIRYLTHAGKANRGKSASRNLGLARARGEYVAFLDGDDVFRPEKLERQSRLLDEHAVAMVYGPTLYWRDWAGTDGTDGGTRPSALGKLGVAPNRSYGPPALLRRFLTDGGTVPCICGLTARMSSVREVGGFDERIDYMFEDQVLLAKLCAQYPVYVDDGCYDQYRQHARSTSRRAILSGAYHPTRPNPSRKAFLYWLRDYLRDRDIRDARLRAALAGALWPYRHPFLYRCHAAGRRLVGRAIGRSKQPGLT